MRASSALILALLVCGCNQDVKVPTTEELLKDRNLLSQWEEKCTKGEYSHLPADKRTNLCSTTMEADQSIAIDKVQRSNVYGQ